MVDIKNVSDGTILRLALDKIPECGETYLRLIHRYNHGPVTVSETSGSSYIKIREIPNAMFSASCFEYIEAASDTELKDFLGI